MKSTTIKPVLPSLGAEKLTLGFIADVLYIKGILCFEELDDIQSVTSASQLEDIFEKMMRGEYNVYKRGEARSAWDGEIKQGGVYSPTVGGYASGGNTIAGRNC